MIELQPFTESDINALIGWIDSAEFLVQWGGSGLSYPLDKKQIENLHVQTIGSEAKLMMFKAVLRENQMAVGHVELSNIDRKNRSASVIRVLVGPETLRGKGIGAEIMQVVLHIGFEQLGLHRLYLHVFDFNRSAIRCYEKTGFHQEGRLRDTHRVGSKYWSVYAMSVLEGGWTGVGRVNSPKALS